MKKLLLFGLLALGLGTSAIALASTGERDGTGWCCPLGCT
jgi:hypothetical protein